MKPQVHVIGLGPGGADLVTAGTLDLIGSIPTQFLRTERHPAASVMPHAQWFDLLYESAGSVDQVYPAIVEGLVRSASVNGEVLYAVPGSPLVAEHSVELLLQDDRVTTTVYPALSFLDLTWTRLGVDPVDSGVTFVDGHKFADSVAGQVGPFLVGQCDSRFVLSDIKLSIDAEPEEPVTVLARLGLPDEEIFEVDWADLDRSFEPDHLTSLWIPQMGTSAAGETNRVLAALADLRGHPDPTDDELRLIHPNSATLLGRVEAVIQAKHHYERDSGLGAEALVNALSELVLVAVALAADLESDGWMSVTDVVSGAARSLSF